MSASRSGRVRKATALVPLAVLSAAWTVNVTGLTQTSAVASVSTPSASLPDGTALPSAPITAPASVSAPTSSTGGLTQKKASTIVSTATSSGIPAAALAAYQRAATVIDDADKSCHLDWPLIAAIGRVESNHGRADGNRLTTAGISTPGIFGPALNGKGTSLIKDTDGGSFDGDTAYDRAVGPMQFIPSTWSMVGVDADGDGKRNPQDINDAALATAVYLCSGDEDLATAAGQRAAVFRYNHSQSYVATVLGVAKAYAAGDYTSVPDNTVTTDWTFTPSTPPAAASHGAKHGSKGIKGHQGGSTGSASGPSSTSTTAPSTSGSGSKQSGSKSSGSGDKGTTTPPPATSTPSLPPVGLPSTGVPPVDNTISKAQATTQCLGEVVPQSFQSLLGGVLGGSLEQIVSALNLLPGGKGVASDLTTCVNKLVN
ncbi:lytic transglycosylase domain-containing protein [Nocardioides sp. DS6]|uniref:Lytic transglycosylase domain-containing protein n=1 Tax=Nocardioides eburneus TaxID=3231482 RepID=A0ABV3STQ5_9ACTN